MEFYLLQKEDCQVDFLIDAFGPRATNFIIKLPFIQNASPDDTNQVAFKKLKHDLKEKFWGDKEWMMSLQLTIFKNPGPACKEPPTKGLTLKGELLRKLQQFCHGESQDEQLELELKVSSKPYSDTSRSSNSSWAIGSFIANEFSPKIEADGTFNHSCYEQRTVQMPKLTSRAAAKELCWSVSIRIFAKSFICLDHILPKTEVTNRKILEQGEFCDFAIISEDGTRFPCHKVFLAKSPVLKQMLQGDFEETKKNEMTMGDMTTQGVNALLEYFYCGDVRNALEQCEVALELLKAADKYDIPNLWTSMTTIIWAKPRSWFGVDGALKLFDFASKCQHEESRKLMKKMLQVLAYKPDQLSKSAVFKEMFPTQVSRELFNLSLEANRP